MQINLNKTSCCNFDEFRVTFDKICDFIPVVSTITMTIGAIQKHLYVPEMDVNGSLKEDHYYTHLKEKDFERKWLLFIPGVNFIVAIFAFCCLDVSNVETESSNQINISHEENEFSSEEIIDIEVIDNEDEDNLNEIEEKKTVDEKRATEEQHAAKREVDEEKAINEKRAAEEHQAAAQKADEEKKEAASIKIAQKLKAEERLIENSKTLELLYPQININDIIQLNPHIDNLIFKDIFYLTLVNESPSFYLSSLQIKRVIQAFNKCDLNILANEINLNYIHNATRNSLLNLFKIIALVSPKNCDLLFQVISSLPPELQSQNLLNAADLFTYSYNDPALSISLLHQIHMSTTCKLFEQTNWHFLRIIEDLIIKLPQQKKKILNKIDKLYIWAEKVIQNAAEDNLKSLRGNQKLPEHLQTEVIEDLAKCLQLRRDILNPSLSEIIENPKLNTRSRLKIIRVEFNKAFIIDSISHKCFLLISAFYNLSLIPTLVAKSSSEESSYEEYDENEVGEGKSESDSDYEDSSVDSSVKSLSSEEEFLSSGIENNEKSSTIAANQQNDFDIETFIAIIKESILPLFVEVMKKK
ncbi:MAG: hypothetical protein H0T62_05070 [Parachlamydiaceae bacterium]|nr:hypothetical protein [Parachlamydiaceae bacterium]